jgi:hypothetical protein
MAREDDDDFSLDNLSPEERAAVTGGAEDEQSALDAVIAEGKSALKAAVADDDDDQDNDINNEQVIEEAKSTTESTPEDKQQTEAATNKEAPPNQEPSPEFQPVYVAPAVENFDERMTALNATKAEAFKKMMDGEISAEEYADVERKYLDERDALRSAQERHITSKQMQEQTAQQRWQWEVENFKKHALKNDGVDYVKDDKMNNALDRWVKVLANDPENANQPGEWFLQEAHKHVKQQYGLGKQEQKPDPKPRTPDLKNIPPTLGRLPSADEGDAGKNEFAHLDKLDGMDLEKALAKMPKEQQDRWLATN